MKDTVETNNSQVELNISGDLYQDIEDDVPDIDESVLFCGVCGLDEDMCLCPHSTFNEKLSFQRKTTNNNTISFCHREQ